MANSPGRHLRESKYRGVKRSNSRWYCEIMVNRKHVYLGSFLSEKQAALAYDYAAVYYFGDFASLNFKRKRLY